ncbi:putative UDP-rhamnose:rhamnosyltransferase 1 [Drosera capensis]
MEAVEGKKLHIVMLPWLAYGHITPFFQLSKHLAQKGHYISFVSTPKNIEQLPKIPQQLSPLINLVKLSFPSNLYVEGLPPEAESTADIPFNKFALLSRAYQSLQEPITEFLENSSADWLIYDLFAHFVPPMLSAIKEKRGNRILQAIYFLSGASSTCWLEPQADNTGKSIRHRAPTTLEDYLVPPKWIPFPCKLAYRLYEVLTIIDQVITHHAIGDDIKDTNIIDNALTSVRTCDAILIHSCMELESNYLKLLSELHGKPVLPTGFQTPSIQEILSREDHDHNGWQFLKGWLDKQEKGSVVYVALGSEVIPSLQMLEELALGLELSQVPFLWALRKAKADEVSLELPNGFEVRVRDRGLIWRNWAPQLLILEHSSVGGFLTHCGWNSTLDALQFGRPFILLPIYADQGINSRFLEEKELGIEIPRDEQDGSFTRNSVAESVRLVLIDEGGKTCRDKAKEIQAKVGDKNQHKHYVDELAEFLCRTKKG